MESQPQTVTSRKAGKTLALVYCALFTALISVGAFLKIPVPVIPFTLQTLFVQLSGMLLGKKYGAVSALAYLLLGLFGLPIFTAGGGFWYVTKPSFGYIIGFCLGAYLIGRIIEGRPLTFRRLLFAGLCGLGAIYGIGLVYFYIICNFVINTPMSVGSVLMCGFVVTIPGDILLTVLASVLAKRLKPAMGVF